MVHKEDWNLILDFDSTIIKGESLDLLAETVFENRLESNLKLQEIIKLTNDGMEGKISFQESLNRRLKIKFAAVFLNLRSLFLFIDTPILRTFGRFGGFSWFWFMQSHLSFVYRKYRLAKKI